MENNTCKLCGSPINLEDYQENFEIPSLMKSEHICYHCAFWLKRKQYDLDIIRKSTGKLPVITPDWSHWIIPDYNERLLLVNIGTFHSVKIKPLETYMVVLTEDDLGLQLVETNNLSHQGTIPEHLREHFNINGIFITPAHWKELLDTKNITKEHIQNLINREINKK